MRKRPLVIGAIVASVALALTGCSSNGGSGSNSQTKVVLQEMDDYASASPQGQALIWLFNEYHKAHPNVTIERSGNPTNELQKLQAQATTNSLPDIAFIDNPNFPVLQATGKLRDLTASLKQWGLSDAYLPGAKDVVTVKGKTQGVFVGTNTLAILYNKDMFAKAGITEPPKTWDEFIADGKKLTSSGVTGFMFSAQSNGCGPWQYNPWQWTADGKDEPLDSPGNVKALSFLTELVKSGVSSKDVVNQCQDQGMDALIHGQTAMIENGPWSFSTLNAAKSLNWGSFPIPVPSEGDKLVVPLGGEVWTLPSTGDSANEQAALDFLKWSQGAKVLQEFDQRMGYVPVQPALWPATEKANPQITPFIESLKYARGRTTTLGVKTTSQVAALGLAMQQAILGQKTPQAALTAAQAQFASQ